MPIITFHFQTLDHPPSPPSTPSKHFFATNDTVGNSLILYFFSEKNKLWMYCMQVIIMIHLLKKVHLILASYLTLCLFLAINIFIGVKEYLDNLEVVNPPGIPVNTKRLPPKPTKQKQIEMELALEKHFPAHASYDAAVINAPYLPMEVTPWTQQYDLKHKD